MEFRFCLVGVLFLVIAANCKNQDQEISAKDMLITSPPYWCPVGYEPMKAEGEWLHACRPINCPGTTKDDHVRCRDMGMAFISCPKKLNMRDVWNIYVAAGELRKHLDFVEVEPGYYEVKYNGTVICDPSKLEQDLYEDEHTDNRWCMPFYVPSGGYGNSTAKPLVYGFNRKMDLLTIKSDHSAHFCFPFNVEIAQYCNLDYIYYGDHLRISFNATTGEVVFGVSRGVYPNLGIFGAEDKTFVLFCENFTGRASNPMKRIYETIGPTPVPIKLTSGVFEEIPDSFVYLHSVAALVSGFSMFLVLVIRRIKPIINENYGVFFCYALSLIILNIAKIICFISSDIRSEVASMALFGFEYIFGLGCYYWITILAFDLLRWLRQPASATVSLITKCVYSWGIPAMMYMITIALHYSPIMRKTYRFDFEVDYTVCRKDYLTKLIVFYVPTLSTLFKCALCGVAMICGKCKDGDVKNHGKKYSNKIYKVCFQLFLVMTGSWLLEIITALTYYKTGVDIWIVSDFITNMLGFFVFLVFIFNSTSDKITETNEDKIEMCWTSSKEDIDIIVVDSKLKQANEQTKQ